MISSFTINTKAATSAMHALLEARPALSEEEIEAVAHVFLSEPSDNQLFNDNRLFSCGDVLSRLPLPFSLTPCFFFFIFIIALFFWFFSRFLPFGCCTTMGSFESMMAN